VKLPAHFHLITTIPLDVWHSHELSWSRAQNTCVDDTANKFNRQGFANPTGPINSWSNTSMVSSDMVKNGPEQRQFHL
jgi:hypothetical protein